MSAKALNGLAAIDLASIHPSPNNVREYLTGIDELASSIRETGLIQPLVVQKIPGAEGFQIVAGHRRYAAVTRLGWTTCPCIIRRDMLPDEELLAMLVENGQRDDLDPIEEARALNRLVRGPVGRPKGAKTKPYFGDTHPLSKVARARCSCIGKPKIASGACGECWEAVIRTDERARREIHEAVAS